MKVLVVTHTIPWPEVSGGRMRAANVIRALAHVGEVDVFSLVSLREGRDAEALVPSLDQPVARFGWGIRRGVPYTIPRVARWMIGSRLPYEIGTRDYATARSAFLAWARPSYDLAWMCHAETFAAIGDLIDAPCVVDLDDLEDHKLVAKLAVRAHGRSLAAVDGRRTPHAVVHGWGAWIQTTLNRRRWHRLQHEIAAVVDAVGVCSRLDRERLRASNAVLVPNGYVSPRRPVGRVEVGSPPTLLLPGSLTYAPNADAARSFVTDILPRVQARIPDARARLIGQYDQRVARLASDAVTLTGRVPEMAPELARGDVVVVPIRFGGGTRIKILEAFAHRVPVVSTILGAEGLEITDGKHLVMADHPDALAAHCVRLLTDLDLRRSLVDAAHRLYAERYTWEAVASIVVGLAGAIAD